MESLHGIPGGKEEVRDTVSRIYLDGTLTTRTDPQVLEEMFPYFTEKYAVSSSEFSHSEGKAIEEEIEKRRELIKGYIDGKEGKLIFTSGGTEANNLAIKGFARENWDKGMHIISSSIEHQSVRHTLYTLEKEGFDVTYLPVSPEGYVDPEDVMKNIREDTVLVTIQHSNPEVGVIQPIEEIGKIVKEKGIAFHVDAAYSTGWIPFSVENWKADMVTLTAHKVHGPKGTGALWIRDGIKIKPLIDGTFHEYGLRGGIPNIPGIIGFAKALELMDDEERERVKYLRDYLWKRLEEEIEDIKLNGPEERHPANLNVTIRYVEGEAVVIQLDLLGVSVTTGSACFSRKLEASYVLRAMGVPYEDAHGSLRFGISRFTTEKEIDEAVSRLKEVVERLRKISPLGRKE